MNSNIFLLTCAVKERGPSKDHEERFSSKRRIPNSGCSTRRAATEEEANAHAYRTVSDLIFFAGSSILAPLHLSWLFVPVVAAVLLDRGGRR